ncbi:MAG TPA: ATP-binding protein [Gammaproteobacteria bacterium]|nr:ATP-binding protein [Gammaproteobacteria bacterium]
MRLGRPRTLLGLLLVGLALVTLPLLIAIGNAALKLGLLTRESEAVATESATTSLETQRIINLLGDMERNARQYIQVVQDKTLLDLYETDLASLKQSAAVLAPLPQAPEARKSLDIVVDTAEDVRKILRSAKTGDASKADPKSDAAKSDAALKAVISGFESMNAAARDVGQGMRIARNEQLTALQESTREAQRKLMWQSTALIPLTIVLILFFLGLIGRPMRQVDRAIRELGSGDFGHAISVTGPKDLETLGRQLEWLRQRLKEQGEEKNKFLRHMSHELKTPLANIREGTELLLDGSVGTLDVQQQEVTGILRENGLKLQALIENLLNFSAWQTKTASLDITEFELKPLVFRVLSHHRLPISNQKIRLQIQVSAIRVRADEGKLRLMLENLVSNAVKFLPAGGVLYIGAEMQGTELVIDVADTGPGIDPEDAGRIFEAFYQGKRPQGGPVGGTGIGLSVVAECVQAHGGTVSLVDGSDWPGAHFRVVLPLRRAADRPALVVNG